MTLRDDRGALEKSAAFHTELGFHLGALDKSPGGRTKCSKSGDPAAPARALLAALQNNVRLRTLATQEHYQFSRLRNGAVHRSA